MTSMNLNLLRFPLRLKALFPAQLAVVLTLLLVAGDGWAGCGPRPYNPTLQQADTIMLGRKSMLWGGPSAYDTHEITMRIHVNDTTANGWYAFSITRDLGDPFRFRVAAGQIVDVEEENWNHGELTHTLSQIQIVFTKPEVENEPRFWFGEFLEAPSGAYMSERWHLWFWRDAMTIDDYKYTPPELGFSNTLHSIKAVKDTQDFYLYYRPGIMDAGRCPLFKIVKVLAADPGMAVYDLSQMRASLILADRPLSYQPAKGPALPTVLAYQEGMDEFQPAASEGTHLGSQWGIMGLKTITGGPATSRVKAFLHDYTRGVSQWTTSHPGTKLVKDWPTEDNDHIFYDPEGRDQMTLEYDARSTEFYVLHFPSGAQETYGKIVTTSAGKRFFPTQTTDSKGLSLTYVYDPTVTTAAKLLKIVDACGKETVFSYGNSGDPLQVTKITDPFGRSALLAYNGSGQLTSITDPVGIVSQFAYSGGVAQSMTTPYGTTTFARSDVGGVKMIQATQPDGSKERVEFQGLVSTTIQPASETEVPSATDLVIDNTRLNENVGFYWDRKAMALAEKEGNAVGSTDFYAKAKQTHWMESPEGALAIPSSEKSPLENRVWYNYKTQDGQVFSPSLARPGAILQPVAVARLLDDDTTQISKFSYNTLGKVTETIDPAGRSSSYVYDANEIDLLEVRQTTGGINELLSSATYNGQHLPLTVTDAAGETTTLTYNAAGQLATILNAKGDTTTLGYDSAGYLILVDGPASGTGDSTQLTYDSFNRPLTVRDRDGYTLKYSYDALDRLNKITYPDSTTEQITYNRLDPEWVKDRENRWTHYFYNSQRQKVGELDPLGRMLTFDWCKCGALQQLTDAMGRITKWKYDVEGRLMEKEYPDATKLTYTYEAESGRLKSVADAKSQRANYEYFIDNQLKKVTYTNLAGGALSPGTPSVQFTYDTNYGRIATMVDTQGTTAYSYNAITSTPTLGAGRLASINGPLGGDTVTYDYDELGRVVGQSINSVGQTLTYDSQGRVNGVVNPLGTFVYHYVNFTSRLSSIDLPNGQTTQFSYLDNTGDLRLQEIKNLDAQSTPGTISKFNYTYSATGNILTWRQENSGTPTVPKIYDLRYDAADQILGATLKNASTSDVLKENVFRYDKAGNRLSEQTDMGVTSSTTNNLNQVTAMAGGGLLEFTGTVNEPAAVTWQEMPPQWMPQGISGERSA